MAQHSHSGRFFSFDGVDGAGKSTQIRLFCAWLTARGHGVFTCRDPGSTPLGERIRSLLLAHDDFAIGGRAEMLLYMAARAQMVEEAILPALQAGRTVVCDRFLLANVVYQGHAGGLDPATLWQIGGVATGGLAPDMTFVLDMDPAAAKGRLGRPLDRMESRDAAFQQRVREGFLIEARQRPDAIVVIDAGQSVDTVHAAVLAAAQRVL